MSQTIAKGVFITFEGGEGVGKSTQIHLLHEYCVQKGYACIVTQEPGGTSFGSAVRDLFLNHASLSAEEELLILLAARKHHIRQLIEPALAKGQIVLCDRYIDSSAVYQGSQLTCGNSGSEKVISSAIYNWHQMAGIHLWPDLTFVLLQNPATSRARKTLDEVNRFDQESLIFYAHIQKRYEKLASEEKNRCIRIETDQKQIGEIAFEIQEHMQVFLDSRASSLC
jgi:dTMP kinase